MQKAVEEYLEKVYGKETAQSITDEESYRKKILREIGFIGREYSPNKEKTGEYNLYDKQKMAYYRQTSVELTDEEWEAVKAAYEKEHPAGARADGRKAGENGVASALKVFAVIIYIGGAIAGYWMGRTMNYFTGEATFSFASALGYWIAFFVAGTMMNGFAEIVRLLQVIADK